LQVLDGLLRTQGDMTTTKGNALEPIVASAMLRFDGMAVCQLPFLEGVSKLPNWAKTTKISLSKCGPAGVFGCVDDLEFMTKRIPHGVLLPKPAMRPDLLWNFSHPQYVVGTCAIKLYTAPVPVKTCNENEVSSDPRKCFMTKAGETPNPSVVRHCEELQQFLKSTPVTGALRIHLLFPGVQGAGYKTRVQGDDIMVYIDCNNMAKFFYDGIRTGKEDMRNIQKIITYISTQAKSNNNAAREGCGCPKSGCVNGHCRQCKGQNKKCTNTCGCKNCKNK